MKEFNNRKSGHAAAGLDEEPTLVEEDAQYVIKEVVCGLNYLSSQQIIHRDIKLDNVMVNRKQNRGGLSISDYEFKLGDMGLARQLSLHNQMADTFAGTPLAMAPELINGKKYSYKADVWSLGTLLFQMLTGKHPFNGRNMEELKRNLKKGQYTIPSHISCSMICVDFMVSCLRFDSVKRKDWEWLSKHDFLSSHGNASISAIGQSIDLNARRSMNLHEVYEKICLANLEKMGKGTNLDLSPSYINQNLIETKDNSTYLKVEERYVASKPKLRIFPEQPAQYNVPTPRAPRNDGFHSPFVPFAKGPKTAP